MEEQQRPAAVAHVERDELRRQDALVGHVEAQAFGRHLERHGHGERVAHRQPAGFREDERRARSERLPLASRDELKRRNRRDTYGGDTRSLDRAVETELEARLLPGHARGRRLGRGAKRGDVPQENAAVGPAGGERARVGREGERRDGAAMAGKRAHVPELGRAGGRKVALADVDRVRLVAGKRYEATIGGHHARPGGPARQPWLSRRDFGSLPRRQSPPFQPKKLPSSERQRKAPGPPRL